MKHFFAFTLLLTAVVAWTFETVERTRLAARIELLRQSNRAFGQARQEHQYWQRREPFADELLSLRRDAAELAGLRRELTDRTQVVSGAQPATAPAGEGGVPFPAGRWVPVASGQPPGQATPQSAVRTSLSAAVSRETGVLAGVLGFDGEARTAVEKILASLPEPMRARHRAPETLIAEWMTRSVHVEKVLWLAEQQHGFDDAVEYLSLGMSGGKSRAVYLRLHREPGGWRLLVPARAVAAAAEELAEPPAAVAANPAR